MKKLIIERTFKAPVEKIWEAFTNPEILKKWWSPIGMNSSFVSVDLKKGGLFRFCFQMPDGKEYWGKGVYQNITKPTFISYLDTFSDEKGNSVPPSHYGMPQKEIIESLVEFKFSEKGQDTFMCMTGDNYYEDSMTDDMTKGWNSMFDKLNQAIG
jgi:uncharacterized protein YndB with AHSA1/START domain